MSRKSRNANTNTRNDTNATISRRDTNTNAIDATINANTNASHTIDATTRETIASLQRELIDARASKNTKLCKGIRRRLRALNYYGGTRTRTNNDVRIKFVDRIDAIRDE